MGSKGPPSQWQWERTHSLSPGMRHHSAYSNLCSCARGPPDCVPSSWLESQARKKVIRLVWLCVGRRSQRLRCWPGIGPLCAGAPPPQGEDLQNRMEEDPLGSHLPPRISPREGGGYPGCWIERGLLRDAPPPAPSPPNGGGALQSSLARMWRNRRSSTAGPCRSTSRRVRHSIGFSNLGMCAANPDGSPWTPDALGFGQSYPKPPPFVDSNLRGSRRTKKLRFNSAYLAPK